MIKSSIRWSFTGVDVLWTRNTSRPRTFSAISIWISPSENFPTSHLPTGAPRYSQISFTSPLFELPEKTTRSCSLSRMARVLHDLSASRSGRCAAHQLLVVLGEDDLLHPVARFAVQRVGDVLESPVFAALGRHRHEQAGIAVDHLEIADDEAVVEGDRDVRLEPFLVDG